MNIGKFQKKIFVVRVDRALGFCSHDDILILIYFFYLNCLNIKFLHLVNLEGTRVNN